MHKLKAIVYEDDIDAVIRSLGEAGVAQIIDLREKLGEWQGVLTQHNVSAENAAKCSELQSRIQASFEALGVKSEKLPINETYLTEGTSSEILATIEKRLAELPVETIQQTPEAEAKINQIREDLITLQKVTEREKQVGQAEEKLARTAKTIYLEAWVPEEHAKQSMEIIKKASNGNCVVADELASSSEKTPIVLKPAPKFLAAFEKLVFSFGYPAGGDINPVNILAVTFPILFGIMFADVGQGALFLVIGLVLTVLKKRIALDKVGDIIRYLLISSEMFMLLGISAILFGFLFGEFFGPSGLIHPVSLGRIGPFFIGGFEPTQEPMKMLRFAVLVGSLHIGSGLVLKFVNEVRHRHFKLVPVPLFWLWLLFGGLYMWAFWGGISNISKWFADGSLMLVGLVVLPLMLVLTSTAFAEGFMGGLGFSVEVFAETLSHTMSYSRLMALGLIHSAMNYLFLVLGGVEHGYFPLASIPMIVIGTILVMIIEGLVVFVHTLRLHWVEWFSKFHTGEGIAFKPFKIT
jgi:V/A-type H+-transporting ATPase subunit I